MVDFIEDDREEPNLHVEDKNGNYIKITDLLKPYNYFLNANYVDLHHMENAFRDYGTDDAEFIFSVFGQIESLRHGLVKFADWQKRFIVSFVRSNKPQSPALTTLLIQTALTHLEVMEAQNRLALAYHDLEYEVAARILTRLMRLFSQQVATYETLAQRRLKLVEAPADQPIAAPAQSTDPGPEQLEGAQRVAEGASAPNLKVVK